MKIRGAPLYQWEDKRQLILSPAAVDYVESVDFSHTGDAEALVVLPKVVDGMTIAEIPNILLQSDKDIVVYSSQISDGLKETVFEGVLHVRPRAKPQDYVYTESEVLSYKTIADRMDELERNGVSQKAIEAAVNKYLEANPIETGSKVTIGEVELLADKWVGGESLYSQVVTVKASDGTNPVTEYSQVDLTPSVEQLAIFHDKDLAFVTEQEDGVVTVYAIGDKPLNDYTMQVTIKEVSV